MDTYSAATLPSGDNVNPYCFCVDLQGEWFLKKGAMIAHYGAMTFTAVTAFDSAKAFLARKFASPVYAQDWVVASGSGKLLLADRGHDVNSFDLDDGNLTVRATDLLGYAPTLELKQSIVPGFLTLLGTGTFLASSNGPVVFVDPPFRADPEALLGWADCPSPTVHYDTEWMSANLLGLLGGHLGRESGEERQYAFVGTGTVLLQSSEVLREDPALERTIEMQTYQLSAGQAGSLGQRLVARAQGPGAGPAAGGVGGIAGRLVQQAQRGQSQSASGPHGLRRRVRPGHGGKPRQPPPAGERLPRPHRALEAQTGPRRLLPADLTAPQVDERAQRGHDRQRHRVSRVDVAHVDRRRVGDQPPLPSAGRDVREAHQHHRAARRQRRLVDVAVHVPHEQVRVEVGVAELGHPAGAPPAEGLDDRQQLAARRRERVRHAAVRVAALHDPRQHEPPQALGQQRGGHPGHAAAQLVEVPAAEEQLPHDEQRPALVEQLHRLAHRAELAVRRHRRPSSSAR